MKTALGCLFRLVLLGVAFLLEQRSLQTLSVPAQPRGLQPALAAALALGLTLTAGGLHGLWVALRARRRHGPTSSSRARKGRSCVRAACSKSTTRRCNEIAAKLPGLAEAAADEAARRERLRRARPSWIFHEQAWPPGQRVTAVGTWRTNPPHLDIGCGPRHPAHALLPGPPAQRARRELVAAVVFTLLLGALTALGHDALRHDDGAWVRRALELLA